jgi:hypothetical protein
MQPTNPTTNAAINALFFIFTLLENF